MPAKPRSEVFIWDQVGIYHCCNQIVRQRYLFGRDVLTGKDYSHRKVWVRERLRELAGAMALDVLDYAVVDNHLHLMVRNRPDLVDGWTDQQVALRWWYVCPQRKNRDGSVPPPTSAELKLLLQKVGELRRRLSDISWFMRLLCQPIARRANREDGVEGRFFAMRFFCRRLKSRAEVLSCSLYVDLNPIHAGLAKTPEQARFTSAFDRIQALWQATHGKLSGKSAAAPDAAPDAWLAPIFLDERAAAYPGIPPSPAEENPDGDHPVHADASDAHPVGANPVEGSSIEATAVDAAEDPTAGERARDEAARAKAGDRSAAAAATACNPVGAARISNKGFLPITCEQYLKLLDALGRVIRKGKRGFIPPELPPIMERLQVDATSWLRSLWQQFVSLPIPAVNAPG